MSSSRVRLVELIGRLCDDELSDAEFAELEQQLASDGTARQVYHAMIATHLRLEQLEESQFPTLPDLDDCSDSTSVELPDAPSSRRSWLRETFYHPISLSLFVSGLYISAVLLSLALWTLPAQQATPPTLDRSQIVAQVVRSRSTEWAAASLNQGKPPIDLFIGERVELLRGTVAIRFDSGAVALVAGPAVFAAQGDNELQLIEGTLTARVPPRAVGFQVGTPKVDVIDLGTEFSVEATATETEVQVLTGRVEVRPYGQGDGPRHELTAGQAARFSESLDQGFYVQETEMNRAIFLSMATLFAAVNPLHSDAAPLLGFEFNQSVANGGLEPSIVQPGVFSNATAMTKGNLTNWTAFDGGYPTYVLGVSPGGTVSGANLATAFDNNWYFEHTFEVAPGMSVDLEELSFQAARGGSATNRGFGVTTSLTGHTELEVIHSVANIPTARTTFTDYSVDLTAPAFSDAFQGLTSADGPIVFRFYIFGPQSGQGVDFDNIILSGTAVPEPSTAAMLGVLGLGLAGGYGIRRQRARRLARKESWNS